MTDQALQQKLIEVISNLEESQQAKLLELLEPLAERNVLRGTPASDFAASAAKAGFSKEDIQQMTQAIEEEFERIDEDEWQ